MSLLMPEWDEMGPVRRVLEAIVLPAWGGFATGWVANDSTGLFVLSIVLAILGAIWIGAQHRNVGLAQWRGVLSGTLFGVLLLIGLNLGGDESSAPWWILPPNDVVVFLLVAIPAIPLHRLGFSLRQRRAQPVVDPVPAS